MAVSGSNQRFDYALSASGETSDGVSAVRPNDTWGNHNPDTDGFRQNAASAHLGLKLPQINFSFADFSGLDLSGLRTLFDGWHRPRTNQQFNGGGGFGYKVGEPVGLISVRLPMPGPQAVLNETLPQQAWGWLLLAAGAGVGLLVLGALGVWSALRSGRAG